MRISIPAGPSVRLSAGAAPAAFDALYERDAPGLLRQAELLTGSPRRAGRAVERAFHQAWLRWPEVAVDPDPLVWVRVAVYDNALPPWRHTRRTAPPGADRELRTALLRLPRSYRRAVLLYDGLGLDLPEVTAESKASVPAAADRITRGRAALGGDAYVRLAALLETDGGGGRRPAARAVRHAGERRALRRAYASVALTAAVAVAAVWTAETGPSGPGHGGPPEARPAAATASPTPRQATARARPPGERARAAAVPAGRPVSQ
jgi:DNA-directed RNA polymerase specialized sigma24 family protein